MLISIIIPTFNRIKELSENLSSVLKQTVFPKEIIVVDNGFNKDTEYLVKKEKTDFEKCGITLKYLQNRENSLAVARNLGIKQAIGDIILFLDDDVILDQNYLKEILKIYKKYPYILGVQGYILLNKISNFKNLINKTFYLCYYEKNKCKVLPSFNSIYPSSLTKPIFCEWLSGANHAFKKEVFNEFEYDEKLKKYSWGEDLDLPYRVFKKYPNSLLITPFAKLIHKLSLEGRLPKKELITMEEVYSLYLFYKNFDQNLKNKLIYLWSRLGKLIFNLGRLVLKFSKIGFIENKYLIAAYIYCLKHFKEIREGDLGFFNYEK